jgi:dTDP-4-dehydrorhamnose reductase
MISSDGFIIILGGKGMLGSELAKTCKQEDFNVRILDLPEFDLTNHRHFEKTLGNAQIIINCAAYTDVDGAESNSDLAYQVNAEAVGRLGNFAREHNKWILHISTDFVFSGESDKPYTETDATNPINTYGKTKLEGEQLLAKSGCKYCILRIEWTYGSGRDNFVTKLAERAKSADTFKVVDDQIGSPTATTEVAGVICTLLNHKPQGIYHFASSGYASRFETAQYIFDKLSLNVKLLPCKTSDYSSAAARPLNSRFNCSKITDLLGSPIEHWKGPLERFLRNI